ncbi:ankyrin [Ilyonectria robusta]
MVSDGHSTEGSGSDRETALIRSASFGHTENVRTLLELGASVNEHDYMQQTAVQRAAKGGKGSVVRVLLDGSAYVNMRASSDWTALMSAVSSGNIEVVRVLVQAGADLTAETVWGDSALSIATRNGQEAIATFLADSGAILPRGLAGHRASVVASQKGLHQLVRRLTQLAPDYESVAQRPLERQASMLMTGLSEAQAAAANVSGRQPGTHSSTPSIDDSDFSDVMEGFDYNIGFSRRYSTLKKLGKGHYAEVFCASTESPTSSTLSKHSVSMGGKSRSKP